MPSVLVSRTAITSNFENLRELLVCSHVDSNHRKKLPILTSNIIRINPSECYPLIVSIDRLAGGQYIYIYNIRSLTIRSLYLNRRSIHTHTITGAKRNQQDVERESAQAKKEIITRNDNKNTRRARSQKVHGRRLRARVKFIGIFRLWTRNVLHTRAKRNQSIHKTTKLYKSPMRFVCCCVCAPAQNRCIHIHMKQIFHLAQSPISNRIKLSIYRNFAPF